MAVKLHNTSSEIYERMGGGCTRIVATQILEQLTPPLSPSSYILDNSCGPGVVTDLIKQQHPDAKIMAVDVAAVMIEHVNMRIKQHGWTNTQTDVLDNRNLISLKADTFTHAITNFGIAASGASDLENPLKAAREVYRVLAPGGVCAVSTWCQRNFTSAFAATAQIIRPHEELSEPWTVPSAWERGWWLMRLMEEAGFGDKVSIKPVQSWFSAGSMDKLAENLMLTGKVFFKEYSEEEMERLEGVLKEEMRKLKSFEEDEKGARIGMTAWIALAWK